MLKLFPGRHPASMRYLQTELQVYAGVAGTAGFSVGTAGVARTAGVAGVAGVDATTGTVTYLNLV